ncbi:hypothetical protein KVG96_01170 [Pseudomonas sp. COR58]|uniref:Uncharacterized protein n=1 Tax=Pseudomonas ekonensis TaxID=2842353 RepID=A0ABS6P7X0_9PSED|nr:hypothetical protein [Pseudomonas ekonensis]MBV4456564.1 hypothetical protein [Pseudomonas ekonensis]
MKTNRQQSFIATLELGTSHVNFLGQLHGTPATRLDTHYSGGFFTGVSKRHNDSHLLGHRDRQEIVDPAPMTIYFRCTDDYYHLYIRSHVVYSGHCVSKDHAGFLGAFLPAGRDTTSFNLLSLDNQVITLRDLPRDTHRVRLQARNARPVGSILRRGAPYRYMGETDEKGIVFTLRILERNASFLSDPDEV